jgi:hypothetical protein
MRSLIKLVVVLAICLAGIGLYRGWFSLSNSNPGTEDNKVNINVSVDKDKMKSDVKRAEEKVKEKVKGEIKELEDRRHAKEDAQ